MSQPVTRPHLCGQLREAIKDPLVYTMSSIDASGDTGMVIESSVVRECLDALNLLENTVRKQEETFDQFVKEQSQALSSHKQKIKQQKEKFYGLIAVDISLGIQDTPIESNEKAEERENSKLGDGASNSTETDLQARIRGNLDLVEKLEQELNKLHFERLLDITRTDILKMLGIGSWHGVKEKATESGMALQDYLIASLKDHPRGNLLASSIEALTLLCANCSFIDPGRMHDLAEAYVSVYGQGVGQSK